MNLYNYKIWALTDGSQGMISQVLGLAQELGNEVTQIKTDENLKHLEIGQCCLSQSYTCSQNPLVTRH